MAFLFLDKRHNQSNWANISTKLTCIVAIYFFSEQWARVFPMWAFIWETNYLSTRPTATKMLRQKPYNPYYKKRYLGACRDWSDYCADVKYRLFARNYSIITNMHRGIKQLLSTEFRRTLSLL